MEEEKKWSVYCHTNKVNGKKYIGITSQKPKQRWNNGHGYKNSIIFYNAILKYGWDNFEHIVLFDNLSKEDACSKEIELISNYMTTSINYGYNYSSGGEAGSSGIFNTAKSKMVCQFSLEAQYLNTYDSITEASRITNISRSNIGECCIGRRNTAGGFQWKYEGDTASIYPIDSAKTRRNESRKRPILQYSLGGMFIREWKSTVDVYNSIGIKESNICLCLNNKSKTAGGYRWKKLNDNNLSNIKE